MKHVCGRRGIAALALVSLLGAACSSNDDVSGVEEIAGTANVSDEPADTDDVSDASSEPADTAATDDAVTTEPTDVIVDGFVFTAPTDDYTIVFPGEPTSTPLPIPLPTGQVTTEAFIYEDGVDAAYFTSVFDYPDGATDNDAEVVLIGARDGAIANVDGALLDSEFVESNGVPGIVFTFDVGGGSGGVGNALVYFDEPRLYQSFALGLSGQDEQFAAFLDTFTFTADQAGDS